MKKILTSTAVIAAVAALTGSLVACGDNKSGNNDEATAKAAIQAVRTLYANKAEETPETYTVNGTQKAGDKVYNIKWTVSSDFANFAEYVKVGDMNDKKQVPITIKKAT